MSHLSRRRLYATDGRRFAPRVQVWAPSGRYIFRTHAENAWVLCHIGAAVPGPEGVRVWQITLVRSTWGVRRYPGSRLGPNNYKGQSYTFLEVVGYAEQRLATQAFRYFDFRSDAKLPRVWQSIVVPTFKAPVRIFDKGVAKYKWQ